MFNHVSRRSLLASTLIGLMALAGCGGGVQEKIQSQSIVGTWNLRSVTVEGETISCPGSKNEDGEEISCGEGTVRFGLDKSFIMDGNFYGGVRVLQRGTWDINGSALTLTINEVGEDRDNDGVVEESEIERLPQALSFDVGLSGDRLTLRGRGESQGIDLNFEKD
ncbi:MAG: hypothetical protein KY468_20135 [Armatimonadetes bacterium]|nr:hypothetical protein [Armatimonadota bacterium]